MDDPCLCELFLEGSAPLHHLDLVAVAPLWHLSGYFPDRAPFFKSLHLTGNVLRGHDAHVLLLAVGLVASLTRLIRLVQLGEVGLAFLDHA